MTKSLDVLRVNWSSEKKTLGICAELFLLSFICSSVSSNAGIKFLINVLGLLLFHFIYVRFLFLNKTMIYYIKSDDMSSIKNL